MPSLYFLAACQSSALDRDTGNMSLFNLLEDVELATATGLMIPTDAGVVFEAHSYWNIEETERGQEFEFRAALECADGTRTSSNPIRVQARSPRVRLVARGLQTSGLGRHIISAEYRRIGEDNWNRAPRTWPMNLSTSAGPVVGSASG